MQTKQLSIFDYKIKQTNGNGNGNTKLTPTTNHKNIRHNTTEAGIPSWAMPNSYIVKNELIYRLRIDGTLKQVLLIKGTDNYNRITGLTKIKETVHRVLYANRSTNENELEQSIRMLNYVYDNYVTKYGFLNTSQNRKVYTGDPDLPTILAIEAWDEFEQVATKNDIFTKRIVDPPQRLPTAATSAMQAVDLSLHKFGKIDKKFILSVLPKSEADVINELQGIIYLDPSNGDKWVHHSEYLSGDVRVKLSYARRDPTKYRTNIEALTEVLPRNLNPDEIFVQLGSPWISPKIIMDFVNNHIFSKVHHYGNGGVYIDYIPPLAKWIIDDSNAVHIKQSRFNNFTWGTLDRGAMSILSDCLNQKQTIVNDYVYDEKTGKRVTKVNHNATAAARNKQERWQTEFRKWLWSDDKRKAELLRIFNTTYNSIVPNSFEPPNHYNTYKFDGMRNSVKLDAHQLGAIWGMIKSIAFGLYHGVGFGKTFDMITANMEMKRLGIIKTGWHVVKNHTLGDYAKEFAFLYPGARLLMITSAELPSILTVIKNYNWDAIIITHTAYEKIATYSKTRAKPLQDLFDEIMAISPNYKNEKTHQELTAQLKHLRATIENIRKEPIKKGLCWEDICTGNIALFVDEEHTFKNLYFQTKLNVAGVGGRRAGRAWDMFVKQQHLHRQPSTRYVAATGTFITNAPAELYTVQRKLQPELMRKQGVAHFDAWCAMFGKVVSNLEMKPSGNGFHFKDRLAEYGNLSSLKRAFFHYCDIKADRDALGIKVPKHEIIIEVSKQSQAQKEYMKELSNRADALPNDKDIILTIINDGIKASLFMPLVKPELLERDSRDVVIVDPESKIGKACKNIAEIYHSTAKNKLTQMVFLDLSTPNRKAEFTVYDIMRDWLIHHYGLKRSEIKFAQDYKKNKHELFNQVNLGRVRVVLGSTDVMGTGVNAQRLLFVLHHIDIGWTPDELFQREGRIIRRKNLNSFVKIFRYVTEGMFDIFRWQLIELKIKPLLQIMSGDLNIQSIKVFEEALINAKQVMALATGNDDIKRYADINAKVVRLNGLLAEYREGISQASRRIQINNELVQANMGQIKRLKNILATYKAIPEQVESFGAGLFDQCQPYLEKEFDIPVKLGNIYSGVEVDISCDWFTRKLRVGLKISGYSSGFVLRTGKDNKETNTAQIRAFFEEKLVGEIEKMERLNDEAIKENDELRPVLDNQFEYSQELAEARKELEEIEAKLKDVKLE